MGCMLALTLLAGLLAWPAAVVTAQDDDGLDGGSQRLEVPEAGVALSLPTAWNVDIEMRERLDFGLYDEGLADDAVAYWSVIYASDGGRPWCDLTWYPAHPLTLPEHAQRYEALMTPAVAEVQRPIEVDEVTLPAGESHRLVIYNEPTDDHTTVYVLAAGEEHYILQCVDDARAADDWISVAESLEVLEPSAEEPPAASE